MLCFPKYKHNNPKFAYVVKGCFPGEIRAFANLSIAVLLQIRASLHELAQAASRVYALNGKKGGIAADAISSPVWLLCELDNESLPRCPTENTSQQQKKV